MSMQSDLATNFQFELNTKGPADGFVYILGSLTDQVKKTSLKKITAEHGFFRPLLTDKKVITFTGVSGPVWVIQNFEAKKGTHGGLLDESVYAYYREHSGSLVAAFKTHQLENIEVNFLRESADIVRGAINGFELAAYNFLNSYKQKEMNKIQVNLKLSSKKIDRKAIEKYRLEACATVLARHLVNLPPNKLNPETVESLIKNKLGFPKSVNIDVWNHAKLAAENMNLHLAVGGGSETPPRMIHIKYRPAKKWNKKPIAFIGKGITFDTGGLDIKPSAGMRLMKKDMGGAAAVIGLAYWVIHSRYERACDFYLALAENAVDAKSMRPSDIYRSRQGYLVEIDNTDAEGRLVLADVMDVAATKKGADEPEILIDIATLTGAIKVALGADVAGLFTNDDQLAQQIQAAGKESGEPNWRMPLVQKYFSSLTSNFADFRNSADGFGGAITAALFLEKFCHGKKWAHLDVYSWNDKPTGALSFVGGSGQPVQSMIEWLKGRV